MTFWEYLLDRIHGEVYRGELIIRLPDDFVEALSHSPGNYVKRWWIAGASYQLLFTTRQEARDFIKADQTIPH